MPWFKVDDSFWGHPKVLAIPRKERMAAVGLWTLAGAYCAQQLTDGRFAEYMLEEFGASKKSAGWLVEVGLWETTEGGYSFHDWLHHNPAADDVRAEQASKQEARARAGRLGGIASGVARRKQPRSSHEANAEANAEANGADGEASASALLQQNEAPTRPDPMVPNGTTNTTAPRNRGARIPDPFEITDDMRLWASEHAPDVDLEHATAEFVDYWRGIPGAKGTKLDWPATWRNRIRDLQERGPRPLRAVYSGHPYAGNPNIPEGW